MNYRYVFMFPGQGCQYSGMGKTLLENYPEVKKYFNIASSVAGYDVLEQCLNPGKADFKCSSKVQVAILTVSYASFQMHKNRFPVEPAYLIGHSLGEYTALAVAEAIGFEETIAIVHKRGQLMDSLANENLGSMVAISHIQPILLEQICKEFSNQSEIAVVSNYNGPNESVISGNTRIIDTIIRYIEKNTHGTATKLQVSAPFHSSAMYPMVQEMNKELKKYKFKTPKITVISTVNGMPYDVNAVINTLTEQICGPVHWTKAINNIIDHSIDLFIDVGPKSILKNLVKAQINTRKGEFVKNGEAFSLDNVNDCKVINMEITKQLSYQVNELMRDIITTKNLSSGTIEEYVLNVIEPFNEIKKIYNDYKEFNNFDSSLIKEAQRLKNHIIEYKKCQKI